MRSRVLAALLLAVASTAVPAKAHASDGLEGLQALAYLAGAIVAVDVGFTVYDGVQVARGKFPSRGAAVAEAVVCGLQIPAGVAFAHEGRDERPIAIAFTAWTVALTTHGIWGALANRDDPSPSGAAPGTTPSYVKLSMGASF